MWSPAATSYDSLLASCNAGTYLGSSLQELDFVLGLAGWAVIYTLL